VQPYTASFLNAQAQRTAPTRQFFYQQINWHKASICIDIGCGAGAITPELTEIAPDVTAIGIDIDQKLVSEAVENYPSNPFLYYLLADAMFLPFRESIASFCLSHFTLMWIPDRILALKEIRHVLSPKGVIATIEPDYSGRIELHKGLHIPPSDSEYPITCALHRLGADPFTGSQVPAELARLDFHNIRSGVLSWQYDEDSMKAEIQDEAMILKREGIQWKKPVVIYTPIWWIIANNGKD
jgi:SAM-dependent methyltransferase